MPITAIISQPAANSLNAAYRPVILRVTAKATDDTARPPVVYCDIYFGGVFYKTLSKSQYTKLNPLDSEWEFDIQDAAQEYLKKYLGPNGAAEILEAAPVITKVTCKFRASGLNTEGFIQYEDTAPVQGTGSTAPVSGNGTASGEFFVLNATLQHEDNQDLAAHLASFKSGTWSADAWPLTHRPNRYKMINGDSDFFPVVYTGAGILTSLVLNYRFRHQNTFRTLTNNYIIACPNVTNLQYVLVNNGNGTQTITFTWDNTPDILASISVGYRVQGSTADYISVTGSPDGPSVITVPLGLYEFAFYANGSCQSSVRKFENIGIPDQPCMAVSIPGAPSLPDGSVGNFYSYAFNLGGTAPFTLYNVTKPSWMTIEISGSSVVFGGTPDAAGASVPVGFVVKNCYQASQVAFNDTLNVTAVANNNAINVLIAPGFMDTMFSPQSCWQWEGTLTLKDSNGSTVATQSWASHSQGQTELFDCPSLTDGTYTLEWSLQSRQSCSLVPSQVRYVQDFGTEETLSSSDSKEIAVSGNNTISINLYVDNA